MYLYVLLTKSYIKDLKLRRLWTFRKSPQNFSGSGLLEKVPKTSAALDF
jgi:hypothetical protein